VLFTKKENGKWEKYNQGLGTQNISTMVKTKIAKGAARCMIIKSTASERLVYITSSKM